MFEFFPSRRSHWPTSFDAADPFKDPRYEVASKLDGERVANILPLSPGSPSSIHNDLSDGDLRNGVEMEVCWRYTHTIHDEYQECYAREDLSTSIFS